MDGPNAQIPQLVARMDPLPRVGRDAAKWRRFSRLPLPSRLMGSYPAHHIRAAHSRFDRSTLRWVTSKSSNAFVCALSA